MALRKPFSFSVRKIRKNLEAILHPVKNNFVYSDIEASFTETESVAIPFGNDLPLVVPWQVVDCATQASIFF